MKCVNEIVSDMQKCPDMVFKRLLHIPNQLSYKMQLFLFVYPAE